MGSLKIQPLFVILKSTIIHLRVCRTMRINKFISESGKSSRRGADKLISEGRITINGKVAQIGSPG
ncbi:ribosomal 50S subunit-recycling heat shock protein [Bacillus sp. SLBN-46]|nr:ribosomal 50S subunit-recycling heat shock protein [Bacillus sp. SLBN-46]